MKIIIVGNGVAGISAAEAIRKNDKNSEVAIYTDEKYYHYSRPRVIEYLGEKVTKEKIIIRDKNFYEQNNIKIYLDTKIKTLDINSKKIILENNNTDDYDKLIIAAGAKSFLPPVKGSDLQGVFTLRTIDDADKIMDYAKDKKSAVVIGGGLLGIEAAISILNFGLSVLIVEVFDRLLPRQLDNDGALILQNMLEEKGLKFLLSKQTEKIEKQKDKLKIIFKDGGDIETDLILFSAGIRCNLDIVKDAGIEIDKGIKINEYIQTSVKDIYAAGDVAEFKGMIYGIWPAAKEQGEIAGKNATGENIIYNGSVISTKLKVGGIDLASTGSIEAKEGVEIFTKKDEKIFKRLFIKDKKLKGAILIGDTKEYHNLQNIIKSEQTIDDITKLI